MTPRTARALVASALLSASVALASGAGAQTGAPVRISAILSLTGAGAFLGTSENRALEMIAGYVNQHGGVGGRPVQFVTLDDQSSPQVAVQLAGQLIANKTALVIGPSIPQICAAVMPLVEKNGPLTYCLNQSVHPAAGSFVYSTGDDSKDVAAIVLRYLRERGLNRVATLMATDGAGQDFDRMYDTAFALPENAGLHLVAHEHFNASDLSVAAQIANIKSAAPQVLVTWSAGTPFGTALRGTYEAGLAIPVVTSGANMNLAQMEQYSAFIPKEMLFSGQIAWTPGSVGPGPVRDAQLEYARTIKAAGYASDAGYTVVWDPARLFVDALRHLGPDASSEAVRAYLANLRGWVGIDGVYDFGRVPQRGLDENAGEILAWDPVHKAFIAVSKPGGHVR